MDIWLRVVSVVGVFIFLGLAYLTSKNRKEVKIFPIVRLLVIQIVLGLIMLKTFVGRYVITGIADAFQYILGFAADGVNFVFGGIVYVDPSNPPFFFSVLLPIIFTSAIIGILQFTKILPFIIKWIGIGLSKISGTGKLESYNAAASIFLGQSEVFISIKDHIGKLNEQRLYSLASAAMASISMSIIGAYMTLLNPEYVVTAVVLNLFGVFIINLLINPYTLSSEEDSVSMDELEEGSETKQSFFEVLGEYIIAGFNVAVIVAAMLIGFMALIFMFNGIFLDLFGFTFSDALGYVFSPLAIAAGINPAESVQAGSIMAIKLVSNEFAAMQQLNGMGGLSDRTIGIVSVFLISFANFSSIGIISGTVKGLNEEKGRIVAKFGLRLVWGATLVSFLSATVVGIIL